MITLQERVHGTKTPEGWKLNKLHRVFRVRKGYKNTGMREDNLLSLSYGRIINKDIDSADGLLPESFETYQIVEPGNIVMRLTDLQNDKRSLRQGLVKERGIITSAYDALELEKGHEPRFWAYALLALDLAKYYYSLGGGVRQSIKFGDFPNDWIATPEQETQKRIARFLDREVERIDCLIEKKQRFIELLNEKETAIYDSAVLGRAGAVENFMPTNVPWIKSIPSHWTIQPIKHLLAIPITDGPHETPDFQDDGVLFISAESIKDGEIDFQKARGFISEEANALYSRKYSPKSGDIYVIKSGATTGRSAMVRDFTGFNIWSPLAVLRASSEVDPEFLLMIIRSTPMQDAIALNWSWGTQQNIGMGVLGNIRVPVPPLPEQVRLREDAAKTVKSFKSLRLKVQNSIQNLAEFRVSLITEAVTGQIDITSWKEKGQADERLDKIQEAMGA